MPVGSEPLLEASQTSTCLQESASQSRGAARVVLLVLAGTAFMLSVALLSSRDRSSVAPPIAVAAVAAEKGDLLLGARQTEMTEVAQKQENRGLGLAFLLSGDSADSPACTEHAHLEKKRCVCDAGYMGTVTWVLNSTILSSCKEVPCPEHSEGDSVVSGCTCQEGFGGNVTPASTTWRYDGMCSKKVQCPSHSEGVDVPSGCKCKSGYMGYVKQAQGPVWYSGYCVWWLYLVSGGLLLCICCIWLEAVIMVCHF